MSRHRSPAGRRARRDLDPAPAGTPVAVRRTATAPARARTSVASAPTRTSSPGGARPTPPPAATRRQAITAAALAGGTLAVTVPLTALTGTGPPEVADTGTALRLAAGDATPAGPVAAAARSRSFTPVAATVPGEPGPGSADAESLIKAAGLADVARKAAEARARVECAVDLSDLGRVRPWVSAAARFLSCLYDQPDLIGVAGRGRVSDHPLGLALDLMVTGSRGDRIAECALRNREALGISYVIWEQRINYGSGWVRMANRGSTTENHFDHVHISFERSPGAGAPDPAVCG
ncbi:MULTISPECIES: hypothetical protein [Pseudonocardia]|nr:hypothetical protein [Pseudonocardia dioxanivorans]